MRKYRVTIQLSELINFTQEQLAVHWHGMLYAMFDEMIATNWHDSSISPFVVNTSREEDTWFINTIALTEQAIDVFDRIFDNWVTKDWILYLPQKTIFQFQHLEIIEFGEREMANIFYREQPPKRLKLEFQSATSFKVQGQYQLFPDVRLIFQSLMMKHSWVTMGEYEVDEIMLNEILKVVRISSYRLYSRHVKIHAIRIPGFVGNIQLSITGNDTLKGYIYMLLKFAEFSGIGIKNAMGMGKCQITTIRRG